MGDQVLGPKVGGTRVDNWIGSTSFSHDNVRHIVYSPSAGNLTQDQFLSLFASDVAQTPRYTSDVSGVANGMLNIASLTAISNFFWETTSSRVSMAITVASLVLSFGLSRSRLLQHPSTNFIVGKVLSAGLVGGLYATGERAAAAAFLLSYGISKFGGIAKGIRSRSVIYQTDKALVVGGRNPSALISAIDAVATNNEQGLAEAYKEKAIPVSRTLEAIYRLAGKISARTPSPGARIAAISKIARRKQEQSVPRITQ